MQNKVDVQSAWPAAMAEAAVQAEHWLNLVRQIGKMAMRTDRRFLATSDPLSKSSPIGLYAKLRQIKTNKNAFVCSTEMHSVGTCYLFYIFSRLNVLMRFDVTVIFVNAR